MTEKELARFDASWMPEPNSGCWLWLASVQTRGYGQVTCRGRSSLAHRVSYEHFVAAVPDGLFVCHRCDRRLGVSIATVQGIATRTRWRHIA